MSQTFYNYDKQQFNADVSLNGATTISGVSTHSGRAVFTTDISVNGLATFTSSATISGNVGIGSTVPETNYVATLQQTITSTSAGVNGRFGSVDTNIAISGNGLVMAVGCDNDSTYGSNIGSVTLYVKSGNTWVYQHKIGGPTTNGSTRFGTSVAITYDGNVIVVGAPGFRSVSGNTDEGGIFVYRRTSPSTTWDYVNGVNSGAKGSQFGVSVAISSAISYEINAGGTLIIVVGQPTVGQPTATLGNVATYVYYTSGTAISYSSNVDGVVSFGAKVALSSDGLTLAVGSYTETVNTLLNVGRVRIYSRSLGSTTWAQQQNSPLDGPSLANSIFGVTVALSSDGNTLAIGANGYSANMGAVYLYTRGGSTWNYLTAILNNVVGSNFGRTVSLSSDGRTLSVSAHLDNSSYGAIYVYNFVNGRWLQYSKIINNLAVGNLFFGHGNILSSDGNTLVSGCYLDNYPLYIYNLRGTQLTLGVGNTTTSGRLCVTSHSDANYSRFQTSVNNIGQTSGIEFGIPAFESAICSKITSTTYINNSNDLKFHTNPESGLMAIPRMTINSRGNVGIGTTSPAYPLDVIGAINTSNSNSSVKTSISSGNGSFGTLECFNANNTTKYPIALCPYGGYVGIGKTNPDRELYILGQGIVSGNWSVGGVLYSTSGTVQQSDKRIKTNIVDIDDSKALSILRKIQPKTYDYIDTKQRGKYNVIGFIAQEIEEIIPNAIKVGINEVPNFYTNCQIAPTDVSNIVLVTSPIDLSWNPLHGSADSANASDACGNAFVDADGNACSDASGNKVFNVKLYDQSNNEINCKTTNVLDKRSFLMDVTGTKIVDGSGNLVLENNGEYFLYGQEVDDFHYLDKSYVYTVVTAAVQDIDRKQVLDEAKIAALENKNAELEAQVASLQSQMAAVLSKLSM